MGDEIGAMGKINDAMTELEQDEVKRVLRWAVDKFGPGEVGLDGAHRSGQVSHAGSETGQFERISDLMDAAQPRAVVEWVLVASYWFQVVQGQENFGAQEVNSQLKDLGHQSKNITDSFDSLIGRRPPAIRQVQKTGSSKQARKRYRLTNEGIRTVERMIRGETNGE